MNNHAKYIGSESNFQITCAGYLDSIGSWWCHVANERKTETKRNKYGKIYSPEGAKLKKMGVKPGAQDVLIFDQRHGFNGLAIELKVGNNKQSENQKEWAEKLTERGWKCLTTYSLDEFIQIVDDYYSL